MFHVYPDFSDLSQDVSQYLQTVLAHGHTYLELSPLIFACSPPIC